MFTLRKFFLVWLLIVAGLVLWFSYGWRRNASHHLYNEKGQDIYSPFYADEHVETHDSKTEHHENMEKHEDIPHEGQGKQVPEMDDQDLPAHGKEEMDDIVVPKKSDHDDLENE